MKAKFLAILSTSTALIGLAGLASPALAEGPHQDPLPHDDVTICKPYYSAADYQAMAAVTEIPAARKQFPGSYLFVPSDGVPHPGVLWLHGSEGGHFSGNMCVARYLAAHGYAALFFCWHDCGTDSLPATIHDVDLARTAGAVQWLRKSRYVDNRKVALTGVSRGAEHAVLLASILAAKAKDDPSIDVPDVVFAHSPNGKIVGAYNWRWNQTDYRWTLAIKAHLGCLHGDPNGSYSYRDASGVMRKLAWNGDDPACAAKPALAASDCWNPDPNGPYTDPNGAGRFDWIDDLCGIAPSNDLQAWSWNGSTEDLKIGSDIALDEFTGPILISEGTADVEWQPYSDSAPYIMARLTRLGIDFKETVIPAMTQVPSPLPTVPGDRVVFAMFDGEPHVYDQTADTVEWSLKLSFLAQHLR